MNFYFIDPKPSNTKPMPAIISDQISQNFNRRNLLLLIFLRIIAIIAQSLTVIICTKILKISLPTSALFSVIAILAIFNIRSYISYRKKSEISDLNLFLELLLDAVLLFVQLYFTGGISNPFISLFLIQVVIAAVILKPLQASAIAMITNIFFIILGFYFNHIQGLMHHSLENDFFNLHLQGMLFCHLISSVLLVIFVGKIGNNLRLRDQILFEQQQMIRASMLATAAAHELGTPLNTISVVINDLKKSEIKAEIFEKNFLADLTMVENQVLRCKRILSEILKESGQERAESVTKLPNSHDL